MSSRYQSVGVSYKWTAHLLATAITLAVTMEAQAQTAPAASTVPDPKTQPTPVAAEEEVIELTPFEVSADKQEGYLAASSLAGTRLNTNLRDVASAITVVTPQFMQDTGATNIESLLVYTTGTEVAGVGGNFQSDDINRQLSSPHKATRVRGLAAADTTRDFFLTDIPLDSYNINNVDIQRGPNAILFGLGSPAGIINSNLKNPNLSKNKYSAEARYGSFGKTRQVLDADQTLIKGSLGIRAIGMIESNKFRQDYKFESKRRHFVSAKWQPNLGEDINTQLLVNIEGGRDHANRPVTQTPEDFITNWWRTNQYVHQTPHNQNNGGNGAYIEGAPASNWWDSTGIIYSNHASSALGGNSNFNAHRQRGDFANNSGGVSWSGWVGMRGNGTNVGSSGNYLNPISRYQNNPYLLARVKEWETAQGRTWTGGDWGGWGTYRLQDPSIFNFFEHDLAGPNNTQSFKFHAVNATARQTYLRDTIGWDVSYSKERNTNSWYNMVGSGALSVDTNGFYRDYSVNENAGRPFFLSWADGATIENTTREAMRATAYYKLNFAKLLKQDNLLTKSLGEHVFTGVATQQRWERLRRNYRQYRFDVTQPGFAGSNDETYQMINYLGPTLLGRSSVAGANIPGLTAARSVPTSVNALLENKGTTYNYRPVGVLSAERVGLDQMYTGASATRTYTSNRSFIWQSFFFDKTVVGLWGWRKDTFSRWEKPATVPLNSKTNRIDPFAAGWSFNGTQALRVDEKTKNWGIMYHLPKTLAKHLPWGTEVSLGYNKSQNFDPSATGFDLQGQKITPTPGSTKDYTLIVNTLDGKLNIRATKYETILEKTRYTANGVTSGYIQNDVAEPIKRLLNGMMAETYWNGNTWTSNNLNPEVNGTITSVGRQQTTPEFIVNKWFFGDSYDKTIANTPIDANWRQNLGTLIKEPLRIRASALDPQFATAGAVKPNGDPYHEPPVTAEEASYRYEWFKAQSDAAWFRPAPEMFRNLGFFRDYNKNANGGWGFWSRNDSLVGNMPMLADLKATGTEFEIAYNPTKNWRISVNGAKNKAVYKSILVDMASFVNNYSSLWRDGYDSSTQGSEINYWNRNGFADVDQWGNRNGQDFGDIVTGAERRFWATQTAEGLSSDQLREWRMNLVQSYDFTEGFLKDFGVGGAVRWESKGIIGYGPKWYAPRGVWIDDLSNPYYVGGNTSIDLWFSYKLKLQGKYNVSFQLNLRDVGESKGLVATRTQSDGSVRDVRIKEGMTWDFATRVEF